MEEGEEHKMSGIIENQPQEFLATNGNHQLKMVPVNGGPIFQDNNTNMDSEGIGNKNVNSNGSGHIANGSNVTRNRPESPQLETDRIDEAKNVQIARSTDLIFLKSVVASNTLERTKKVCCFLSHYCSRVAD